MFIKKMMHKAGMCNKLWGTIIVVLGVLFLLQDLGIFAFWGISWYTAAFLIGGAMALGGDCCCCASGSCDTGKKGKKK